ncbi:MAG: DUF3043 domain-containing protein [Actinobacteria bacterium]|nr:DUF3043 domain-containing protein [Actinomycetota bacterium]
MPRIRRISPRLAHVTDNQHDETTDSQGANLHKGRPTRTRAEAEAERKALLNPTSDKKAERAAARKVREEARQGQVRGDERFLPARDRGPVRAFMRDMVDSRFNVGEIVMPAAFVFIFLNFIHVKQLNIITTYLFFGLFLAMILDQVWLGLRASRVLKEKFGPRGTEGTKGAVMYAVMRSTQLRRLRVPLPRVQRGKTKA